MGPRILTLAVVFEGGILLLAWLLARPLGTPLSRLLALDWSDAGWGVLATTPLLTALAWSAQSRWAPLTRLREKIREVVSQLFSRSSILDLALISVLAGLCEEALFRGVLQTALADSMDRWLAVALVSVLFGFAHFVSLTYAVYAAVVGAYLGLLMVLTGNLLVPMLTHSLYDFVALTYLVHIRPSPVSPDTGPAR